MCGLTSSEGNRGEDVKAYAFYHDVLPVRCPHITLLDKDPPAEYPYTLTEMTGLYMRGGGPA